MNEYNEHDIEGNSVGLVEKQTFMFAEPPEEMTLECGTNLRAGINNL